MSALWESGWNWENQAIQLWEDVAVKTWVMLAGNFPNKERINYLSLGNQTDQVHEMDLAEKPTGHILCHNLEKTWSGAIPESARA